MPPWDSTIALRLDPYRFIGRTCAAEGTDAFMTRVRLERCLCMSGPEPARVFYDPGIFSRRDATPGFLKSTLFGMGGLQGLDGTDHAHRKAQWVALMGPDRIDGLVARADREIEKGFGCGREVAVQPLFESAMLRAVCDWAGVPHRRVDAGTLSHQLATRFREAAAVGFGQIRARRARDRTETWAKGLIADARAGRLALPADRALAQIAAWTDRDGSVLPLSVAAVEWLNLCRPFVAVSVYLVFLLHALAEHEAAAQRAVADPAAGRAFVQEVRRLYPFFPMIPARTLRAATVLGHELGPQHLVLLDIYGTNRSAALWDDPEEFRPERFLPAGAGPHDVGPHDAFAMVPQGGGAHARGHRCPGEWSVIETMVRTLPRLAKLAPALRPADRTLAMRSLPALPQIPMRAAMP